MCINLPISERCVKSVFLRHRSGFTLIEAIVFIVVVSAALTGVLITFTTATQGSVDPLNRKQALAIAEAMMDEIESMPYTYCDPDDPAASTATSTAGCTTVENIGPEPGETRYGTNTPFDNVNDYNGYNTATESPTGIKDIMDNPITGLSAYDVAVSVNQAAVGVAPATDGLHIVVTVSGPANTLVTMEGYRTRYAPNAVP